MSVQQKMKMIDPLKNSKHPKYSEWRAKIQNYFLPHSIVVAAMWESLQKCSMYVVLWRMLFVYYLLDMGEGEGDRYILVGKPFDM